ncbi:MAG: PQQ-dependent sugar dehydrogenase [Phycisphaeraceae bacterium]|nr:PQQ-dependent sugar dehydrogenase [Phycisphaeraceae bacterium]
MKKMIAAAALVAGVSWCAHAQTPLTTERIAAGLSNPLFVTHAPGDDTRIFIVEQRSGSTGRIRIYNLLTNTLVTTPFLSISGVSTASEQGLLGLAFHPNYLTNGYFWVNYTNSSGTTVVARYQATGDPATSSFANLASAQVVLTIAQPFSNHNGGWIAFGPDGYLYIATGDGGSGGDPGNRAQDTTNQLLGKMLRIDVDGPDNIPGNADDDGFPADATKLYTIPSDNPFVGTENDDEIWAYGLRNHWRNSFDRETGDLWIADVGQNNWEEINIQPTTSTGGENYGWRCYEGNNAFNTTGCASASTMKFPIHVYNHSTDGFSCSVTGGYVYRGPICDLRGTYFFADYCSNRIKSFRYNGVSVTEFTDRTVQLDPPGTVAINSITSFGEDNQGNLYIVDGGGEVFRLIRSGPAAGDYNGDTLVDVLDILDFFDDFGACFGEDLPCGGLGNPDFNGDTVVDVLDFLDFLDAFGRDYCV